jgi:hypothetical protein
LCTLKWTDINDKITIDKNISDNIITPTKTNNIRHISLFCSTIPFFEAQRHISKYDNTQGYKSLETSWEWLLKRCNLEDRVLYQARHTFTIKALDSGRFTISEL